MNTPLTDRPRSLVIPVYRNEDNIPPLLAALDDIAGRLPGDFEVVFVIDGSPDRSYERLWEALPKMSFDSQLIALSKNFGAFSAIRAGMEIAHGEHLAVLAADLQEPPELLLDFMAILDRDEADVVFGQREGRRDNILYALLSNTYWAMFRKFVLPSVPKGGVDVFACNQAVCENVLRIREPNSSLIAQLFWVGFRRRFVPYERRKREIGRSAWHFGKRFRYMLDSVFSFTDLPIVALLWVGGIGMTLSIVVSMLVLAAWIGGAITVPGYTPQMLAILFFGSLLLLTQGILGSYLWRAFENTKRRPLTIIQHHHVFSVEQREASENAADMGLQHER